MSIFAIWPMLGIVGSVLALLSLRRVFAFLDSPPSVHTHRLDSIDGIRGFLATAVVFHHFILHGYGAKTGQSMMLVSHFYAFLGPAGVALFFMITGYLFWDRLLRKGSAIDWTELFVNRFFRIYPLYFVLMLAYFTVALSRTDFRISQSVGDTVSQVLQWLALGVVKSPAPFLGVDGALAVVGQTWSLRYEWLFYAFLPMLAVFARERWAVGLTAAALLFVLTVDQAIAPPYRFFVAEFLCGMLAASILRKHPSLGGASHIKSAAAVVLIVGAFRFTDTPYSVGATLMLGGFFLLIASGATLFGALITPAARRLGNMSYSLYLLHGLVLTILMTRPAIITFALERNCRMWAAGALVFCSVVVLSMLTYYFVELRGIALGKRAQRALKAIGADQTPPASRV